MEVELGKSYEVHLDGRLTVRKAEFFRGHGKSEKAKAASRKGNGNENNRADSAIWHNLKGCRLPIGVQHGNKTQSKS